MSKEMETSEDIANLVKLFYTKVYDDDLLAPVFQDVAKVNFVNHLPTMINFWESVLLGAKSYHNNTYQIHHTLHQKFPLSEAHFTRWISLFHATVDEHFHGPLADKAKLTVDRVGSSMKMGFVNPLNLGPPPEKAETSLNSSPA